MKHATGRRDERPTSSIEELQGDDLAGPTWRWKRPTPSRAAAAVQARDGMEDGESREGLARDVV